LYGQQCKNVIYSWDFYIKVEILLQVILTFILGQILQYVLSIEIIMPLFLEDNAHLEDILLRQLGE